MNILLINTYKHGGAGIACRRLQEALTSQGHEVSLLTQEDIGGKWPFYAERLSFLPFEKDKSVRFSFSLANFGTDISQHPLVQKADVINLHWVNQGFLSLKNIRQLAATGKPLFWTLHDMWAFTGGCHYSRGCRNFEQECGNCNYLHCPSARDLSHRIWQRKKKLFPENLKIITCSEWLAGEARRSGLFRNSTVQAIPNPINTDVFKPLEDSARQQVRAEMGIAPGVHLLLFVAMKVSEERKGFRFLLEALDWLKANTHLPLEILVLGKAEPEALAAIPYPVHPLGLVSDTALLTQYYGLADVFAIPSLEDNLPNTVMESLACGTPVVGFETGGIPEMVEHHNNGVIVPQGNGKELGQAIHYLLSDPQRMADFRMAARNKVLESYAFKAVEARYIYYVSQ